MNQSASSSSNTITRQGKYDVFLSFRGEDTRYNFTSHLYTALTEKKIPTFIDDVGLVRGEEISPSLLEAIEGSKISVVILSENYASSKWCLEELVKIVNCMRNNGLMVIPVFYRVDPCHVRNQTGCFAGAFLKHEKSLTLSKVQSWKTALKDVANLSGWDSLSTRQESELIKKIREDVLAKLKRTSMGYYDKGLVGIESRIQHITPLLSLKSSYVKLVVGIWGMGGLGKTTLARAIYDQISTQFESCCFIADTREQLKRRTLAQLQNELFSSLLEEGNPSPSTLNLQKSFVKDQLHRKKVLAVVDDVNNSTHQQELLLLLADLFGPGSRILVTSRDKQVLKNKADVIYTMEELNEHEALQLFSMNAFKQDCPLNDRLLQAERVINYVKGNPLALRVLGSALFDRSDKDWESMVKRLGNISNSEIHNVLKTSFDGLDSEKQSIFLDIACFFRGKSRGDVTKILGGFDSDVHFAISTLNDRSLIMVKSDNVLGMHDLLQEMGRKIAVDESRQPENRTRLLNPEDVSDILEENKGNEAIEGISLNMSMAREIHLEPDVFTKMHRLRFLELYWPDEDFGRYGEEKLHLSRQGLRSLPKRLRYLHWTKFSLKSIPSKFFPESLVVLRLRDSKVKKLWDGVQNLVNLIEIDFSESQYLTGIPDLSKSVNIETIKLNGCRSLVDIHLSIQYLHKLEFFYLEGCEKLKNLPRRIESKALKVLNMIGCLRVKRCPEITQVNMQDLSLDCAAMTQVPESMLLLSTVLNLYITNCRKVLSLPRNFCKLKSLRRLSLRKWSELESFPEILEPMNLVELDLSNCKNLRRLPDSIYNLKSLLYLDLEGAGIRELPSSIENLSCILSLELSDCRYLESLPSCNHRLPQLKDLLLMRCESLSSLPEFPPSLKVLMANDCMSLQTISSNFSKCCNLSFAEFANCSRLDHKALEAEDQFITQNCDGSLLYPGSEVPGWFTYKSMGSSITIQFPLNRDQFKGVVCCIIFEFRKPSNRLYNFGFKIDPVDPDNSGEVRDGLCSYPCPSYIQPDSDHVLIVYHSHNPFKEYSATLSSFQFCPYTESVNNNIPEILKHCKVKKCGVHLLQDDAESIISPTASSSISTSSPGVIVPRGSAPATIGKLRPRIGSSIVAASTTSSGGIGFYTDDAPGLVSPTVVLVISFCFIGFVTTLHVIGKFYLSKVATGA